MTSSCTLCVLMSLSPSVSISFSPQATPYNRLCLYTPKSPQISTVSHSHTHVRTVSFAMHSGLER